MFKYLIVAAIAISAPALAGGQAAVVADPVYKRAQTLVNDGNATAGRALVDSMIAAAAPGSNEYAEGIYWRAVLAGTAADAEMDYRRIVVDYPHSPRVEDALIRLAQLEIARANYDGAVRHLTRLVTDYPQSPSRARAGYWMARALFEKNDLRGGCTATADALSRTSEDDAELRNQITYLNQRCAGVDLSTPVTTVPTTTAAPTSVPPATAPATTATQTTPPQKTAVDSTVNRPPSTEISSKGRGDSVAPKGAETASPKKTRTVAVPKTEKPSTTEPASEAPGESAAGSKVYSVQVAAYDVKSQAVAMVAKLKKRGYEARVDGTVKPFRVRIGKYATSSQASAVQRSLKAKQITGFVVQASDQ